MRTIMSGKRGHDRTAANSPATAGKRRRASGNSPATTGKRRRASTNSQAPTGKRRRACARVKTRGPRPTLPVDLVLEIVARSDDAATVVRCAAGSKSLRRDMLDPSFGRRRAALEPAARRRCRLAERGAAKSCFDPGLLEAVYYRLCSSGSNRCPALDCVLVETSRPPHSLRLGGGGDLFSQPFQPLSWRDELLVLRKAPPRGDSELDLLVLNTFTGHVTSLPPEPAAAHRPALLSVDDGSSFELLVMDGIARVKIFSSRSGEWRGVRLLGGPLAQLRWFGHLRLLEDSCLAPAAVTGRSVHRLGKRESMVRRLAPTGCFDGDIFVLALDLCSDDTAQVREIELPKLCLHRMERCIHGTPKPGTTPWCRAEGLVLHATVDGGLGLVVAENFAISMWTLPAPEEGGSSAWSRQMLIQRSRIQRQIGVGESGDMRFKGFGPRSGTVIVEIRGVHLVQLNLVTKNAVLLHRCTGREKATVVCIQEVELASLLQHMKPF